MALARCPNHPPDGRLEPYTRFVEPVGHPDSGLICGIKGCVAPSVVWLTDHEAIAYDHGDRIFDPPSTVAKFQVR